MVKNAMKTRKTLSRSSVRRTVRRLLCGKYKDSCAQFTEVAGALRSELNAIGVAECDHLIAVMNMSPKARNHRLAPHMIDNETQDRQPEYCATTGSAVCSECEWTNVSLLNLGEPGKPRMVCHGCCKRALEAVDACRSALKQNN